MPHAMTPRRFARLSVDNAAAKLADHGDFLLSYPTLTPHLQAYIDRSATAKETLVKIQSDLLALTIEQEARKAEVNVAAIKAKSADSKEKIKTGLKKARTPPRYTITVFGMLNGQLTILQNKDGDDLVFGANDYSSAERLADRRLANLANAVYAEINGHSIITRIERRDAIARFFKKPKSAVCTQPKKSAELHWRPVSRATRSITQWAIQR